MTRTSRRPARTTIITSTMIAAAVCFASASPALAVEPVQAPAVSEAAASSATVDYSAVLAATAWETTSAVDQNGTPVALNDTRAANYVGWAYYNEAGTFTMYTLDDQPKMQGDWTVAADGSSRWIAAKNDAGDTLFERTVPITVLTANEFTYRVVDQADPTQWVDIIHTPTDHQEPGSGGDGGDNGGDGSTGGDGDGGTGGDGDGSTGGNEGTGGNGEGTDTDTGTGTGTGTGTENGKPGDDAGAPKVTDPAVSGGQKGHQNDTLAQTGGSGAIAAAAGSALALLGGVLLFARRLLRVARD